MKSIANVSAWLNGKKTYLMASVYAADAFGTYMQWWETDAFRTVVEQVLAFAALRAGVK